MSMIETIIRVDDDGSHIITGLLSRFVKGQNVRVALTDEVAETVGSKPDLRKAGTRPLGEVKRQTISNLCRSNEISRGR